MIDAYANRVHLRTQGFTIVELLVVIVVIGILAAVSVVAYRGISASANDSVVKTEISQFYKYAATQNIRRGDPFQGVGYDRNDAYRLISAEDVSSDCSIDVWSEWGESVRSCLIYDSGRKKIEAYLGGSPSPNSYYTSESGSSFSLFVQAEPYYNYETGELTNNLVIYSRSKSGKVFLHRGSIDRVANYDIADHTEYLVGLIEVLESELQQYDACASGGTCEYGWWTPYYTAEWNNYSRDYYVQEIARNRDELNNVEERANPSLASYIWHSGDHIYYSAATDNWYVGGEG